MNVWIGKSLEESMRGKWKSEKGYNGSLRGKRVNVMLNVLMIIETAVTLETNGGVEGVGIWERKVNCEYIK